MTAEAAEMMVDFVERPTEPFLGGLEKESMRSRSSTQSGNTATASASVMGSMFNERGQVLKLKYAVDPRSPMCSCWSSSYLLAVSSGDLRLFEFVLSSSLPIFQLAKSFF